MENLLKYKKIILIFLVFVVITSIFSGCATVFKGSTERLFINSFPSGADVYINNQKKGTTPYTAELITNNTYQIKISKDKYKDAEIIVKSHISGTWVILDIICVGVPVIVDAITGSWYTLETNQINIELEKNENI